MCKVLSASVGWSSQVQHADAIQQFVPPNQCCPAIGCQSIHCAVELVGQAQTTTQETADHAASRRRKQQGASTVAGDMHPCGRRYRQHSTTQVTVACRLMCSNKSGTAGHVEAAYHVLPGCLNAVIVGMYIESLATTTGPHYRASNSRAAANGACR